MKEQFKKITKGYLAILIFKILLIGSGLLIQSCEKDTLNEQASSNKLNAFENFEKKLILTSEKIPSDISEKLEEMKNYLDSDDNLNGNPILQNPTINSTISDLRSASEQLLVDAYGFTSSELSFEFNEEEKDLLMYSALLLYQIEKDRLQQQSILSSKIDINKFLALGGSMTYASGITFTQVGGCAAAALGIDILGDLKSALAGKKLSKKLIRKTVFKLAKLAGKYLSGVGLAITGIQFGICIAGTLAGADNTVIQEALPRYFLNSTNFNVINIKDRKKVYFVYNKMDIVSTESFSNKKVYGKYTNNSVIDLYVFTQRYKYEVINEDLDRMNPGKIIVPRLIGRTYSENACSGQGSLLDCYPDLGGIGGSLN